jgi:DNA-binding response OmpR family regulator
LEAAFQGNEEQGASLDHLPDLILADIMMPLMDGFTFYERVVSNPYLNHIPFIFLTAKSSGDDIRQGKELGVDDYLTKPFAPEDLLASIRGKLKRVKQRRTLAWQFLGEPGESRGLAPLIIVLAALIIFILGALYLFL